MLKSGEYVSGCFFLVWVFVSATPLRYTFYLTGSLVQTFNKTDVIRQKQWDIPETDDSAYSHIPTLCVCEWRIRNSFDTVIQNMIFVYESKDVSQYLIKVGEMVAMETTDKPQEIKKCVF